MCIEQKINQASWPERSDAQAYKQYYAVYMCYIFFIGSYIHSDHSCHCPHCTSLFTAMQI